jgi:(p)ppGpp synthase/HD superfamily hydrolase
MLTSRFVAATDLACHIHREQVRKYTQIPYVAHLLSVAALVLENGGDEDLAIAGLLHDALEDSPIELVPSLRAEIEERFGQRVAQVVEGCTDGLQDAAGAKSDWRERKEAYLEHLEHASEDVVLVCACDKLHNVRAIVGDLKNFGPGVFDRFKGGRDGTLWYYGELAELLSQRHPGPLSREISRGATEMRRLAFPHVT